MPCLTKLSCSEKIILSQRGKQKLSIFITLEAPALKFSEWKVVVVAAVCVEKCYNEDAPDF